MDGTNRTKIVEYKTEQPTAVTLDLVKKLVYWADAYLDFIEVVDYNGKNRHTIIQGNSVRCAQSWFLLLEPMIFMRKRPKLLTKLHTCVVGTTFGLKK